MGSGLAAIYSLIGGCIILRKKMWLYFGEVAETLIVLFAWLISRIFSANEQYFSLTTNQPTVLSTIAYQPNEQGKSCADSRNCSDLITTALSTSQYCSALG